MVTNLQEVTYHLNLFSIKHNWRQLLAEIGASITNIKCLSVLQTFRTPDIRANLTVF